MSKLEAFGEFKTLKEWSEDHRCTVPYQALHYRYKYKNWDLEKAITKEKQTSENRVKMKVGDSKNRLTLMEIYKKDDSGIICSYGKFKCNCDLGKIVDVKIANVYAGKTKSCGCLCIEKIKERSTTHGMANTSEYRAYHGAIDRCYNKNDAKYPAWGGRGIKMCDKWLECFENFYEDMGPKPAHTNELDRMDENWHYCKENCRWATKEEAAQSRLNNRQILAWGECKSLLHWTRDQRCKAEIDIIKYRLWELGWSTEKSIETVAYLG